MLLPLLPQIRTLPKSSRTILYCFLVAIGYAFIIGFVRVAFAAVYSLAEVLAPIAVFGYILTLGADEKTKDRWLRTAAWCAILASAYGWYQYSTIPPWDAFWVREVGMEGYLGLLEPMKLAAFSTMAERGVLGGFLGLCCCADDPCLQVATSQLAWSDSRSVGDFARPDAHGSHRRGLLDNHVRNDQSWDGTAAAGAGLNRGVGCRLFRDGSHPGQPATSRTLFDDWEHPRDWIF